MRLVCDCARAQIPEQRQGSVLPPSRCTISKSLSYRLNLNLNCFLCVETRRVWILGSWRDILPRRGVSGFMPHFRTAEMEKRGGSPAASGLGQSPRMASQHPLLSSIAPWDLAPPLAADFILASSLHFTFTSPIFYSYRPNSQQNSCGPT